MTEKCWSLYPFISASMPFQLALDEILLQEFLRKKSIYLEHSPLFRFYVSDSPWISLGYSRRGFKRSYGSNLDPKADYWKRRDLPVCRRITGGGRVVHGRDLIFSLIAQKSSDPAFESVRISYLKIHEAVKFAFQKLGIESRFYRCDENLPKGEDCFRFPIATDLAIGSHKIAGGAQKRTEGVMLHQESVKIPSGISTDVLRRNLLEGFKTIFSIRFADEVLEPSYFQAAKSLAKEKYFEDAQKSGEFIYERA